MKHQTNGRSVRSEIFARRSIGKWLARRASALGRAAPDFASQVEPLEARQFLSADSIVTFNEIQYHPSEQGASPEWVELRNQNAVNVDLSGWRIGGGIDYTFPEGTVIPGSGRLVVSANPAALEAAIGFPNAMGPYSRSLSNGGDLLILYNNSDRLMDEIEFGDNDPWPVPPDGSGVTLAKIHPNLASGDPANWTWSLQVDGTPGADNFSAPDLSPVTSTVFNFDSPWRYDDSGADLGTAWTGVGYNDASWQVGPGLFYAGDAAIGQASDLLVGYWTFDDDLEDLSIYQNDGILVGGSFSSSVPAAIGGGKSMSFAAGNGGVSVPASASLNLTTFTLSYWINNPGQTTGTGVSNGGTGHNRITSRGGDSFETTVNNTPASGGANRMKYYTSTTPGWRDTTNLMALNAWVHMAWVFDGSLLTLYSNGSPVFSEARNIVQSGELRIGARVGGTETFVGSLDDVALWKVPLDAASIQSLANGSASPFSIDPPEPPVTTLITVATNTATWRQSTTTISGGAAGTWVPSATLPPATSTYTVVPTSTTAAGVLPHITTAATTMGGGTTGLMAGINVRYYRTTFELPEYSAISASIQLAVDNGAQVYINGVEIGREVSYLTENWGTPYPSLQIAPNGAVSSTKFDARAATFTGWIQGTNEVVLAVRNPSTETEPAGAFAFRMDLTVTSPPEGAPLIEGGDLDSGLNTELTLGSPTYYFRKSFVFNDDPSRTTLQLGSIIDDGAVFYLNGVEIHRQNMPGGTPGFNTLASSEVVDAVFSDTITLNGSLLIQGTNVLSVEVHQDSLASTDMLFGASLTKTVTPTPPEEIDRLRINEVGAGGSPGFFVEILNDGATAVDLAGYVLAASTGHEHVLGAQTLAPGALASFTAAQLGFTPGAGDRLFLYAPGKPGVADGVVIENRLRGRSDLYDQRWMYPSAPTPGATNVFNFEQGIVINEVMYHDRHLDATPGQVISTVLMPINSVWRYNQTGTGLPTGWANTVHPVDGSTWFSGPALLGIDTTPAAIPEPILTPLSVSTTRLTYYFEREFDIAVDPSQIALQMRHVVDDGMIVYINGQFAYAFNMSHPTTPTTLATSVDNAVYTGPIAIPSNLLQMGTNRISVEVHQGTATSSDVIFGLELSTVQSVIEGHPYLESDEEWIELYNRTQFAVDLSGWSFDDAVSFDFPLGTTLGAGEYLVISNNAAALAALHPGITILGDFNGGLSNGGERIALLDAFGNLADEVRYYDDGQWPEFADGGGSSLELRDPWADNNQGQAWGASDESAQSPWQTITYTGRATNSIGPTTFNEFVMGLLDSGRILIDDISVIEDPAGAARQVIQNGSFEGGTTSTWRIIGTHQGQVIDDPDMPGNHVLQMTATGATEHIHNHAETTLKAGASFITINAGLDYQISLRVKWITGSNLLNTRLYFNRLQRTTVLEVPQVTGTPGAPNSALVANIGPTYQALKHEPVMPLPTEPVKVSVEAADFQGVTTMQLFYSVNGSGFSTASMALAPNGRYEGVIPQQGAGAIVQFYVRGVDSLGAVSMFPPAGPASRALYQVEDGRHSPDAKKSLRIVMTQADSDFMHAQVNVMSNASMGGTVIYDEDQVFYDIGVHIKGSERGRNQDIRAGFIVDFNPEQLFRGVHQSIAIDRSGAGNEYSQKEIIVKHIASSAGDLPHQYDDLIYVATPRTQLTGSAMLSMARYNSVFLDSYFENGSDGGAFEYELIYYPTTTTGGVEDPKLPYPNPDGVVGVPIRYRGPNEEEYRWNFLIKNNRDADDYSPILRLTSTLSLTGQALYDAAALNLDVDEWLRAFALLILTGIGDSYGSNAQHNLMLYSRPDDGRVLLLPHDMDFAFSSGSTSGVETSTDLSLLIGSPANRRAYYGHLHDFIQTTFNAAYMNPWVAHYDGLLPNESFTSYSSYIATRSTHVSGLINSAIPPIAFAITTNGGADQTVNTATIDIQGTGWVNVREIYLQGETDPLPVTWISTNTWRITLPLGFGANPFTFQAYDFQGNPIGSDSITITSTSTDRPQYDFLRITEVNYHPHDPTPGEILAGHTNAESFEFIELLNTGALPLDLTGAEFDAGVTFDFSSAAFTTLAPGGRLVIVSNPAAFTYRYGVIVPVAGQYTGQLSNGGEGLRLLDNRGQAIHDFEYSDSGDWPGRADGNGSSLEVIDTSGDYNNPSNWRASGEFGGTPGAAGAGPIVDVIINEALAHTDLPSKDSIELYNTTGGPIDISGWWLSDATGSYTKHQFPNGTIIGPGAYLVVDEDDFNPTPLTPGPGHFALSGAHGDDVWLLRGAIGLPLPTAFADHVEFGASFNGVSFGRVPDGDADGKFFPQISQTLGGPNAGPKFGPVVISEVMYNPPGEGFDPHLELIEIYNRSSTPVDLTGWRLQNAVDFDFPFGTIIAARGSLVVMSFNPTDPINADLLASFEATYGPINSRFIGGYTGSLSFSGQSLKLESPDDPPLDEPLFTPHPLADEVDYDIASPWPSLADGLGASLIRRTPFEYGNDAASWFGRTPTPGAAAGDVDGDGVITAADIDAVMALVGGSMLPEIYDLDGSGSVTQADVVLLVQGILNTYFGDANLSGGVSIGDLTILAENFGLSGGWALGDFNGDGVISIGDLTLLAENFGAGDTLIGEGDGPRSAGLQALGDGDGASSSQNPTWDHIRAAMAQDGDDDDEASLIDLLGELAG